MDKLQRYIILYSNYVSDIMIISIAKYINLWWMENAGSNADPHTHEAHDSIMRSRNIWIKILISINIY